MAFIAPSEALAAVWEGRVLHATLPGGGHTYVEEWHVHAPRQGAPTGRALRRAVDGPAAPMLFLCMQAPGTLTLPSP